MRQFLNPTRSLLAALGALLPAGIALGALEALERSPGEHWHLLWWGALLALAGVALVDALRLTRLASPRCSRSLPARLALGRWTEVELSLASVEPRALRVEVHDHPPAGLDFAGQPQALTLDAHGAARLRYRIRPEQRGRMRFERCEISLRSPFGLWRSRRLLPRVGEARVYPDFTRLHGADFRGLEEWLARLGVHPQPRRGLGLEFHQLREYRDGDTLRQIDWKATARMHAPITREYQDERDQQVLLMLDCGRRMRSQEDHLSHFDHALNASLLLAYAALRQGDAVGVGTFACETPRFVAPGKGNRQLGILLDSLYDASCSLQPADYLDAVDRVLRHQKRRALVIFISNLRDEDDDQLQPALARLSQRHRVMFASLREEVLEQLRQQPVERYDDALAYCGTVAYTHARQAQLRSLQARRVPIVEARPAELGPALVQRYLAMKRAGAL